MLLLPFILGVDSGLTLSYRISHIRTGGGSKGSLLLVGIEEMESG